MIIQKYLRDKNVEILGMEVFKDLQDLKILETPYYYCDFMTILTV
jgi:hypothetical protein